MKIALTLILSFILMTSLTTDTPNNFHDFKMKDIRGREVSMDTFKGKAVMVVNTASNCGYTPQYKELQALYEKFHGQDFVILGFPANEFGGQEPGSNEEIAQFCEVNYGVTFPMFSKVVVKGEGQHDLFGYLTSLENPDFTGDINWNFEKFLIDKEGNLVRRFRSRTNPMSNEILQSIETILKK